MKQAFTQPLFANRFSPLTDGALYLEAETPSVVDALEIYLRRIDRAGSIVATRVAGPLEDLLPLLLPIRSVASRFLVLSTESRWTAVFSNPLAGLQGGVPQGALADLLDCRSIETQHRPQVGEVGSGGWPKGAAGTQFCMELSGRLPAEERYARVVSNIQEDGWDFSEQGTPLPGEVTTSYRTMRGRKRFDLAGLASLARLVGIDLLRESFYAPSAGSSFLVVWSGPVVERYPDITLEEAQKRA